MTGFDTAAELQPGLHDRAGIWGFLRRFQAAWDLPAEPRSGLEERVASRGIALPAAMREAFENLGILDPADLTIEDGVLMFAHADPAVTETSWGVALNDPADDPQVLIDTGDGWQPYLDRFSLACVDLALTMVINDHPHANASELPADLLPSVAEKFARIPLPDLPMWVDLEESPVRWFSGPGQLLRTHGGDDGAWLWIAGRTAEDVAAVQAALPDAEWSH